MCNSALRRNSRPNTKMKEPVSNILRASLIALIIAGLWVDSFPASALQRAASGDPCPPSIAVVPREHGFGPAEEPKLEVSLAAYSARVRSASSAATGSDELLEIGYIALELGKVRDAIRFFLAARDRNTFRDQFYQRFINYWLGMAYEKAGKVELAEEAFTKHGDPYYVHLMKAERLRKSGKIQKAEREYLLAQSVQLYEMLNYEPFYMLAEMFLAVGQFQMAKDYIMGYLVCAEYEAEERAFGSAPRDDQHIKKATKLLGEIKKRETEAGKTKKR